MIKKTLLPGLVAIAFFASCKKDNGDTGIIKDQPMVSIAGNWSYLKDSINFYKSGKFDHSRVENYATENMHQKFNADGTGDDGVTTFTYKIVDNKITFNFAAYTANGNQYAAETQTATILELSAHKLYYYFDFIATGDNSVYATLSR